MDIAQLQLEIDSRKAQQAKKDLENLTAAAEKTEAATESLSQANKEGEDRTRPRARTPAFPARTTRHRSESDAAA
ncbi:hypothetical protein [Pusillimonas sp.]|uniref:hypothetical protein n=1 Tax=Pusillimonas sp. TaxID=3040095 RepID=UPI0037C89E99